MSSGSRTLAKETAGVLNRRVFTQMQGFVPWWQLVPQAYCQQIHHVGRSSCASSGKNLCAKRRDFAQLLFLIPSVAFLTELYNILHITDTLL